MASFLIKRDDGHFLRLAPEVLASVGTSDYAREDGWGLLRLRHVASGDVVVIDDEMPGLRVWFEGGALDAASQQTIVSGIAERLGAATGHAVTTIPIR